MEVKRISIPDLVYTAWGTINWKKSYKVLLNAYTDLMTIIKCDGNGNFISLANYERKKYRDTVMDAAQREREYERKIGRLQGKYDALLEKYQRDVSELEAQIEQFLTPSSAKSKAVRDPVTNQWLPRGGIGKDEKMAIAWERFQNMGAQKTPEVYNYISHVVGIKPDSVRLYVKAYDDAIKKYWIPAKYIDLVHVCRDGATGICTPNVRDINFNQVGDLLDDPGDDAPIEEIS